MVQRGQKLCCVKASTVLGEEARLAEVIKQRASVVIVGHKIQLVVRLERIAQAHDVRVAHLEQNVTLGLGVLYLSLGRNHVLLEHLHGIHLALRAVIVLLSHQHDLAECTLADDLQQIEISHGKLIFIVGRTSLTTLAVASAAAKDTAEEATTGGSFLGRRGGWRGWCVGYVHFGVAVVARRQRRGVVGSIGIHQYHRRGGVQAVVAGHDRGKGLAGVTAGFRDGEKLEHGVQSEIHTGRDVVEVRDSGRHAEGQTDAAEVLLAVRQTVTHACSIELQVDGDVAEGILHIAGIIFADNGARLDRHEGLDAVACHTAHVDHFTQVQVLAQTGAVAVTQQRDVIHSLRTLHDVLPHIECVDLWTLRTFDGNLIGGFAAHFGGNTVCIGAKDQHSVTRTNCALNVWQPSAFGNTLVEAD
mmetsp:Transcript_47507/g.83033  ORF Transcript_47507/g.83033 Transcript_47507/m.83033 type:complete len:416 (-) Transcript_47507:43-1290(-)